MSLTNEGANLVLTWLLTDGTALRPASWEVSLHTGDPGVNAADNEVTTGMDADYARKPVSFSAPASEQDENSGSVSWTVNSGSSGYTVTHAALWDATNGISIAADSLTAIRALVANQVFTINAGQIVASAT